MEMQTSPYLTCILPDRPFPVVYVTEPPGSKYPEGSPPGDASFGVITLNRTVVWHSDIRALAALEFAAKAPVARSELNQRFSSPVISDIASRNWLQNPADLCKEYLLRTGQIEITAHCNWRCNYCPVSKDPKPNATMEMDLFEKIIAQLSEVETIDFVTFHFYNEPTLDVLFKDRVSLLSKYNMKLLLASNGSALTKDKALHLRDSGVLHQLIVNMPTLSAEGFGSLTGSNTYDQTMRNTDYAIGLGLPTTIAVNGSEEELAENLPVLNRKYEPLGAEVSACVTCDRAGALEGKYGQDVQVSGRLRGCSWPVNHAHFSVDGDMFICCNDYYKREVFGNIQDCSLHSVMTSSAAVSLRRKVFGIDEAACDFVCRTCHDQKLDFAYRPFRPPASFPLLPNSKGETSTRGHSF